MPSLVLAIDFFHRELAESQRHRMGLVFFREPWAFGKSPRIRPWWLPIHVHGAHIAQFRRSVHSERGMATPDVHFPAQIKYSGGCFATRPWLVSLFVCHPENQLWLEMCPEFENTLNNFVHNAFHFYVVPMPCRSSLCISQVRWDKQTNIITLYVVII